MPRDVTFFFRYPYLAVSLLLVGQAVLALVLVPRARSRALLSGFLATPSSLLSFAFVPDYWQPARVAVLVVGPEDLLFSFSTGVLAWLLAERFGGRGLTFDPFSLAPPGPVIRRHLSWSLLFLAIFLVTWAAGMRPMDATLLAAAVLLPLVATRTRGVWRLGLAGGAAFTVIYGLTLLFALASWPHFFEQWSHDALWGSRLASIPAEEFAWAAAFGLVWPLTLADSFTVERHGALTGRRHGEGRPKEGSFESRPRHA